MEGFKEESTPTEKVDFAIEGRLEDSDGRPTGPGKGDWGGGDAIGSVKDEIREVGETT